MFSFGEILNRESFLFSLDLEIKKARRYRDYLSLLSFTFGHLNSSPGTDPSISLKTLGDLVKDEIRDTDIVGQAGANRLLVMLPYADMAVADKVKERLKKFLQVCGLERTGFTIDINEVCFPTHATNVDDLLQIAGNNVREDI